jgi:hypothetical protein
MFYVRWTIGSLITLILACITAYFSHITLAIFMDFTVNGYLVMALFLFIPIVGAGFAFAVATRGLQISRSK